MGEPARPGDLPGYYTDATPASLQAADVATVLAAAAQFDTAQDRLGVLMRSVDAMPNSEWQRVVIREAIVAAKQIPDRGLGDWLLAVGPLRWLAFRTRETAWIQQEVRYLVNADRVHEGALLVLAEALGDPHLEALKQVLAAIPVSMSPSLGWRTDGALRPLAKAWNRVDHEQAIALATLMFNGRTRRHTLRAIGAIDHPEVVTWMNTYGKRQAKSQERESESEKR